MRKFNKKAAAVMLAAALSVSGLAGCGSYKVDGTATAAVVNDVEIPMGTANLALRYVQANREYSYYSMTQGFGLSIGGLEWDEKTDGKSSGEVLKEDIMTELEKLYILKSHAEEYGVALTDEETQEISDKAQDFMDANDAETLEEMGIAKENVEEFLTLYTYQVKMKESIGSGADTNVTDDEAKQSTISYGVISFSSDETDDDGNKIPLEGEEKEALREKAQKLLDAWKQKEDAATLEISDYAKEIDEELSGLTYSYGSDDTILDDKLKEAANTLSDGELYPEVVEGASSFYVVRMDKTFDAEATEEHKTEIVEERKTELYNDTLNGWVEDSNLTIESAWKKAKVTDKHDYLFTEQAADTEEEE